MLKLKEEDKQYYSSKKHNKGDLALPPTGVTPCSDHGGLSHSIQQRHKLVTHNMQRRPPPYAMAQDTQGYRSKNKDINKF